MMLYKQVMTVNDFGKEFAEAYKENKNYPYFIEVKLDFGIVLAFNAPAAIYNNCFKIAREKAKYTMDYSQKLSVRTQEEKTIKQFKGILAETAVQLYLILQCNIPFDKVYRWDLERESFKNASGEYDIKIVTETKDLFIESRASDSYVTTLNGFVKYYDIIGAYSNLRKTNEKIADLYLRPVYQFVPCIKREEWSDKLYETYKMLQAKSLRLYLVSGATKEEMYGENSYTKNMNQGETLYRCLKIADAGDINRISEIICDKFTQLGGCLDEREDF